MLRRTQGDESKQNHKHHRERRCWGMGNCRYFFSFHCFRLLTLLILRRASPSIHLCRLSTLFKELALSALRKITIQSGQSPTVEKQWTSNWQATLRTIRWLSLISRSLSIWTNNHKLPPNGSANINLLEISNGQASKFSSWALSCSTSVWTLYITGAILTHLHLSAVRSLRLLHNSVLFW